MTARTNTLPIAALRKEQSTIHSIHSRAPRGCDGLVGKFKCSLPEKMSKFASPTVFRGDGHRSATRQCEWRSRVPLLATSKFELTSSSRGER